MLNRKRLECDAANLRGRTLLDQLGIVDLAFFQCPPRLLRRVDRAGRAVLQSPCVIRMRVCEHDRAGLKTFKFSEPIKSAINHHVAAAIRHQQRSVHAMSARPRLDLTACAEKREFHRQDVSFRNAARSSDTQLALTRMRCTKGKNGFRRISLIKSATHSISINPDRFIETKKVATKANRKG